MFKLNDKTRLILMAVVGVILLVVNIIIMIVDNKKKSVVEYLPKQESKEVVKVDDFDVYYTVDSLIKDLYSNIGRKKADYLANIYSKDYLVSNGLNKSNIISKVNPNNRQFRSYLGDCYYVCNSNNCFIYAEAEGISSNMLGTVSENFEKEYYLITVDLNNGSYNITPLSNERNLFAYANDNQKDKVTIELNDDNKYELLNPQVDEYISLYLYYARYLLESNSSKISEYFYDADTIDKDEYITSLGSVLYSYENLSDDLIIKYKAMLYNGRIVTIDISGPNKFKLKIN